MVGPTTLSKVNSPFKPCPAGAATRHPVLLQNQYTHQSSSRNSHVTGAQLGRQGASGGARAADHAAAARLGTHVGTASSNSDTRLNAAAVDVTWGSDPAQAADASAAPRRTLDRVINLAVLGGAGAVVASKLLGAEAGVWEMYQQAVATSPIEAKACISGMVYSLGDIIAQGYEGRDVADWDRGRIVRSGICGLIAHGPLSHLYYVGLDHVFAQQTLLPADSWAVPVVKIAIDQTAWSLLWNSCYYVLLGVLKFESPATIAQTVRASWWDLLKAGWRLWPLVHVFTYGVIPVQHRLLFVDSVELVWVSILSAYAQQQREKAEGGGAPAAVACALPGADGEGGSAAEEILRGLRVEREIVFEDQLGNRTSASPAEVYAAAAAAATGSGASATASLGDAA